MALNQKDFNKKLSGVITSAKSQRDNVQILIVSGLELYKEHRNTGQLTQLIQSIIGVKSLPTTTIKEYIKAHANLRFVTNKNKDYVFKAMSKDTTVEEIVETWYNWSGNKEAKPAPDMDIIAQAKSLLTRLKKAALEGHIKDADKAKELEGFLIGFVKA